MHPFKLIFVVALLVLASCNSSDSDTSSDTDTNQPPTVSAGAGQNAQDGETITLTATASDTDGTIATYSWLQTGGTMATLSGADTATLTVELPDLTRDEEMEFTITVTDDDGSTASDIVLVQVEDQGPLAEGFTGNTIGLVFTSDDVSDGYVLYTPQTSEMVYLINNDGERVHEWTTSGQAGNSTYLLEDGRLVRTLQVDSDYFVGGPQGGSSGGGIEILDWDGNILWEWTYTSETYHSHHDVAVMPNGNILFVAWDRILRDEAVAAGRDPDVLPDDELWPEKVIEVRPLDNNDFEIVWEWRVWDHLVQDFDESLPNYVADVSTRPERFDVNYTNATDADWQHANAIDYNPDLDLIVISSREHSEFFVIDHSTTTEEAATSSGGNLGRGGDILMRWGNPATYGVGTAADKQLFGQHNVQWIKEGLDGAGNILLFNNGDTRTFSEVLELEFPQDYTVGSDGTFRPEGPLWTYSDGDNFHSQFISGAQRLESGNTLICSGAEGRIFEVTPDGDIVWEYVGPISVFGPLTQGDPVTNSFMFRAEKYPLDYPAFEGRDLTPYGTIED